MILSYQRSDILNATLWFIDVGLKLENRRLEKVLRKEHEERTQMLVICSVVGSVIMLLLVLLAVFWCKRQRRNSNESEGHDIIPRGHHQIAAVLRDYRSRPRTRSIEDVHYQFGMNEIDKVTVNEGGDLVRIPRPLETVGSARKLSEELFGIEPIISDGNGGTKQSNTNPSRTGTEGEEGASP